MIKKREKSVLKNLNLKNTLFSLFYNGLMEIYFTPDFIEPLLVGLLLIMVIVFLWCCLKVSSECSRWEEEHNGK